MHVERKPRHADVEVEARELPLGLARHVAVDDDVEQPDVPREAAGDHHPQQREQLACGVLSPGVTLEVAGVLAEPRRAEVIGERLQLDRLVSRRTDASDDDMRDGEGDRKGRGREEQKKRLTRDLAHAPRRNRAVMRRELPFRCDAQPLVFGGRAAASSAAMLLKASSPRPRSSRCGDRAAGRDCEAAARRSRGCRGRGSADGSVDRPKGAGSHADAARRRAAAGAQGAVRRAGRCRSRRRISGASSSRASRWVSPCGCSAARCTSRVEDPGVAAGGRGDAAAPVYDGAAAREVEPGARAPPAS